MIAPLLAALILTIPTEVPPHAFEPNRRELRESLGPRVSLALIAKGADLYTTAVALQAGGVEANRLQPTVEHRVGIALIEVGGILGIEEMAGRRYGARWSWRLAVVHVLTRLGLAAWNLAVAERQR